MSHLFKLFVGLRKYPQYLSWN